MALELQTLVWSSGVCLVVHGHAFVAKRDKATLAASTYGQGILHAIWWLQRLRPTDPYTWERFRPRLVAANLKSRLPKQLRIKSPSAMDHQANLFSPSTLSLRWTRPGTFDHR